MIKIEKYLTNDDSTTEEDQSIIDSLILGKHNDTLEEVRKTNLKELEMGIKVEMEHVPNGTSKAVANEISTRIALDHLAECKTYYTRLAKMEQDCSIEDK